MSIEVTIDPGRIAQTLRLRIGVVARHLAERTAHPSTRASDFLGGPYGRGADVKCWECCRARRGLRARTRFVPVPAQRPNLQSRSGVVDAREGACRAEALDPSG